MTILVPIMMFGWPLLAIILFSRLNPRHAVLASLVGGWLFLPMTAYDIPGLPPYSKTAAASLGILFGILLFDPKRFATFRARRYDMPILIWCLCPIASSFSNGLGFYDGLSGVFKQILEWGIPYLAGRLYFSDIEALMDIAIAIVIGGLLYVPLCLYEVRMSPQLSNIFYGFFPHSFAQHFRYGGYRPIVFMQHGLMVALWMAVAAVSAFWIWKAGKVRSVLGVPMPIVVLALMLTAVLCKSFNGWFALLLGCSCYYFYRRGLIRLIFLVLIIIVPLYMFLRSSGVWSGQIVQDLARMMLDDERYSSIYIRMLQEDLFSLKALQRPFFGWAGWGRGWPVDPYTGRLLVQMIDSMWLVALSSHGYIGLVSLTSSLLMGPWLIISRQKFGKIPANPVVVLGLVIILYMIDSLMNGMPNPVYVLLTGAVVSFCLFGAEETTARAERRTMITW